MNRVVQISVLNLTHSQRQNGPRVGLGVGSGQLERLMPLLAAFVQQVLLDVVVSCQLK